MVLSSHWGDMNQPQSTSQKVARQFGRMSVYTAPAVEPVLVADMKTFLRVDGSEDDTLITNLIASARWEVEKYLRRALISQTLEFTMDSVPLQDFIELPYQPLVSVTSVTTYNTANTGAVFANTNYQVDTVGGRIYLNDGCSWPTALRIRNAFVVRYAAGYGAAGTNVPSAIVDAIRRLVALWYEHRGDVEFEQGVPAGVQAMLRPFKVMG